MARFVSHFKQSACIFFRYVQILVQKKEKNISGAQKIQEYLMTIGTTIAHQGDKTTLMGYELNIFGLISM